MAEKSGLGAVDAYDSMFGSAKEEHARYMPHILPMELNHPLINGVMERARKEKKWVLARSMTPLING